MTRTFKALSLLLSYPTAELQAAIPAVRAAIAGERLVGDYDRIGLDALCADLESGDLLDIQERYVLLFDRTRTLSLHLFEHIHGESRDRGQAMVDLMALYEDQGLAIDARELPDYLPLFLEFLSILPLAEARGLLGEPLHIVTVLAERHRKRKTIYACVFAALETLAAGKADGQAVADLLAEPEADPNDLEALDRAWEDAPVTFGPAAGGTVSPDGSCPAARATLAQMTPGRAAPRPALDTPS